MFSNRVEIRLNSILGPLDLKDDPIGYDESEFNLKRSEKTHGIFLEQINNLQFYGKAKQYLDNLWVLRGPQAKCQLIRKEKHRTTDEWELKADGFLDFTTRKIKDGKLSLDFVQGGMREILTSQMREKFELDRTTDINGKVIPGLLIDTLSLAGRDIFLLSKLESKETTAFVIKSGLWISQGDYRAAARPAPLTIVANSDPDNISPPFEFFNDKGGHDDGPNSMFFTVADRDRGLTKLKVNLSYRINDIYTDDSSANEMKVFLRRYRDESETGGDKFTVDSEYEIQAAFDPRGFIGTTFNPTQVDITFDPNVTTGFTRGIEKGASFGLFFWTRGIYGDPGIGGDTGQMQVFINEYTGLIEWAEDSYYAPTTAKCLTAFDVGKRLTEIYTGIPSFESYLLEGKNTALLKDANHNLVFSPGGWLRNLTVKEEDGKTSEWPIEFSFEDFYKSTFSIMPTGYGIATKGKKQYVILEDLKFFFQDVVAIKLGKITIKERSTAVEYCYQSLKFGYTKGGNYEKPLGLDEYNIQTTSRTPLTVTDNEYEALGPSRTDSYAAEDARRQQAKDSNEKDTPYDKDNFMFDVKKTGFSTYEVRKWQDDFESAPTGIYSPETAYNLNLTPGRNRERHAWWFNNAIVKLDDEAIQFVNSTGNSSLKTKKVGENALKENVESIPIPDLEKPLFEPEWIDAEADYQQSIMDQILGTTLIDGRQVNNYYCKVEFINEKNRKEKAFIYTVKVKNKFTFKLLKAYGS